MKIRNIKYFFKEGFTNIWANKWMSIASSLVVAMTLFVFGAVFLLALNADSTFGKLEDQPMHAFTIDTADKVVAGQAKTKIEKISGVKKVVLVTKEEGLNELKQKLDNHEDLFAGIGSNFLSYKLVINIDNPNDANRIKTSVEALKEIKKVNYAKDTMEKFLNLTKVFRVAGYIAMAILGVVTLFIIMYTIKLTVFARRREINIMKYVGATDWFIKWPFVIEGIIIGVIGAMVAILILIIIYNYLYSTIGSINIMSIKLIPLDLIIEERIILIFALVGAAIGTIGSIISVSKYLDV